MNAIAEPRLSPSLSPSLSPNLNITARDVTGQRTYAVKDLPADTTVQDLVRGLIARMGLPRQDSMAGVQSTSSGSTRSCVPSSRRMSTGLTHHLPPRSPLTR